MMRNSLSSFIFYFFPRNFWFALGPPILRKNILLLSLPRLRVPPILIFRSFLVRESNWKCIRCDECPNTFATVIWQSMNGWSPAIS
jgi:hypothetical protein